MTRKRGIVSLTAALIVAAQMISTDVLAVKRSSQTRDSREQNDQLVLDTSFGFPVHIAYSSALVTQHYRDRVVFLLIDDRYCSPDVLRSVFEQLANRYQEADYIEIDVYSDPEMLRRAIERYKRFPDELRFPDTPEGEVFEKAIRGDLFIPKNGWARARYFKRPKDGERFVYKPDPQKVEMVEVVVKPGPAPKYTGDLHADLFLACRLNDLPKAKGLIDNGARIEYKNEVGETALVYAVAYNSVDIVKLLLARGAYVDARNKYGQTALNEALSHGFHQIVHTLLEHDADINARYGPGISPLHLAAYIGDADAVEALLSKGADPNAVDADGNTPLFGAIRTGKSRMVGALLQRGAWVNVKNKRGESPLIVAKQRGDEAVIKLLEGKRVSLR